MAPSQFKGAAKVMAQFLAAMALVVAASSSTSPVPPKPSNIQIIGHRGAPYYVPEHTLASYEIAMRQGVDWIEPDLCITKDKQLVIVHDLELGSVTDIGSRPEFAGRNRSAVMGNGRTFSGWIVSDFTLAEIKTLRVKQRVPFRGSLFDGLWEVPTLDEALELLGETSKVLNRSIGVYIETKHPSYFASIGLQHDELLFASLKKFGFEVKGAASALSKVIIQSFESSNLKRLRSLTDLPLVQLIDLGYSTFPAAEDDQRPFWELMTRQGLAEVAKYANGIGPDKNYLIPDTYLANSKYPQAPGLLLGRSLVDAAHAVGLVLHPYTFRNPFEDKLLVSKFESDALSEYAYFFELGVDGVFTEWAGEALCAARVHALRSRSITPTSKESASEPPSVPLWSLAVAFASGAVLAALIASQHWIRKNLLASATTTAPTSRTSSTSTSTSLLTEDLYDSSEKRSTQKRKSFHSDSD